MATTTTVISDLTYIFKENDSYLNQENWQDFFNSVIPSGFVNHACSYSNSTQKLTINTLKGITKGLSVDVDGDDFELQVGESSLFFIALDLQDNKVKLYQTKDISGNVVAKIREYISSNMAGLDAYIDHQVFGVGDRDLHTSYLPIAYGYRNSTLNTTYADLGKLITSSGQSFYYQIAAQNSGTVPTQPDCGQISQYGLAQIYGGHNYDITIKSSFVPTEYLLYPVPACSMEPANVRVKNDSGGQITIKVPKQSAYSYFEYVNDGLWVDDGQANGYISFLLPADGDVIITFTQTNQYCTEASSVISSHSVYMISQNVKDEDTGDSYTKAEANSLFALKTTTEAALANKADVSVVNTKAPIASPAFTGTPTAPTPSNQSDDSTKIATTAWVNNAIESSFYSAELRGQPTAPTPDASSDSTRIATTEFVKNVVGSGYAPINSPAFTGMPTAPTPAAENDSTRIATTEWVKDYAAPLASPVFTGTPKVPTQSSSDNSTNIANTTWVRGQQYAPLASPALTGNPTAPTPEVTDNSTKIATTEFVRLLMSGEGFTLYVNSTTGSDSNSGTSSDSPLLTLGRAIEKIPNYMSCQIIITPGTYYESNLKISGKYIYISTPYSGTVNLGDLTITNESYVELRGKFKLYSAIGNPLTINKNSTLNHNRVDGDTLTCEYYAGVNTVFSVINVLNFSRFFSGSELYIKVENHPTGSIRALYASGGGYVKASNITFSGFNDVEPIECNAGIIIYEYVTGGYRPLYARHDGGIVVSSADNLAPIYSPAFTGTPTAPTPDISDNSTRIATTEFVHNYVVQSQSTDIYVDGTNGNDTTGTGSITAPFATIQKAIDNVPYTGGRAKIHVAPGSYTGRLTIDRKCIQLYGTSNTEIRIIAEESTIFAPITVDNGGILELGGVFSLYGKTKGISVKNNSFVKYIPSAVNDELSIVTTDNTPEHASYGVSVVSGGKFVSQGTVEVHVAGTETPSYAVYAEHGAYVAIKGLYVDMRNIDFAVKNYLSTTMIESLTGTYGTASVNEAGFLKIGA